MIIKHPYACGSVWCIMATTEQGIDYAVDCYAASHSQDPDQVAQAVSKAIDDSIWNYTGCERNVLGLRAIERCLTREPLMDMLFHYQDRLQANLDALRNKTLTVPSTDQHTISID